MCVTFKLSYNRIRNHHATVLNIAICAQEYFWKSLSLNSLSLRQEMHLESLLCKEKSKHQSYGAVLPSSQMIWQTVVRWVSLLKLVLGGKIQTLDIEFSMPKTKGTVQTSVSSHRMGDVHMCEGTAEAYIWTVQKHLLPWKWHLFPGNLWSLEWDTARPPSARAMRAWFMDTEWMCLTGLPAVQISLLLKISGVLWKGEWDNEYLGLLKLVKSCIKRD